MRRFTLSRATIYLLAIVVGAVAGLGALAFEYMSGFVVHFALVGAAGYEPEGPRGEVKLFGGDEEAAAQRGIVWWWLLVLPALGCMVSSLLCQRFAPEAKGHGTDAAIEAYHQKGGRIRGRVPPLKAICSAITLGCGGSGGREGPIAQIGAGFGSFLGQRLGLGERQIRTLLAAGMASGVGAIFRAPFAGALFAAEILYRDAELESEAVIPAFLASTVAYCVFCGSLALTGSPDAFNTLFLLQDGFRFEHVVEMVPYTLLAVGLVPAIWFYTRTFYGLERWFTRLPGPRPVVAAFGGLLTGVMALGAWWLSRDERALAVLSSGYGVLQQTLDGKVVGMAGAGLLLLVALGKIVATSCTIGAGGSAGVFGPSMVIGGGVGGAVGLLCSQLGWVDNPASLCIVGMCGFFAGAAKTPISTIVMVTEMTGSYQLLLPAVWVCGITFLLSRRSALYQKQVLNRAFSPAHKGEYVEALLERMKVADVFEPKEIEKVTASTPLRDIVQMIAHSRQDYFPVTDDDGRFVGMLSVHDVRQFTFDESVYRLAIAADIMSSPPVVVRPGDDLHKALETFDSIWIDELPVVDADDPDKVLGQLRRRAINRAYTKKLKELRALQERQGE
ncbi:MAG: chloride channel protein [Planctomycetes bacterium]|nr:chloride channel protein [Planctomycetota bacterium]